MIGFRYRVPVQLGGGEYDGQLDGDKVLLNIPGVGLVPFDADKVTKVEPEEPGGGWVCVQTADDPRPFVFSRPGTEVGEVNARRWWWHDKQQWVDWPTIYGLGTPRRLTVNGILISPGKGLCPECRRMKPLRVDGLLSNHDLAGGRGSGRCPGSNKKPGGGS